MNINGMRLMQRLRALRGDGVCRDHSLSRQAILHKPGQVQTRAYHEADDRRASVRDLRKVAEMAGEVGRESPMMEGRPRWISSKPDL